MQTKFLAGMTGLCLCCTAMASAAPAAQPTANPTATPPAVVSEDYAGPVLHMSHWRTLFYGYDTLSYRLVRTQGAVRLAVTVDYGDRDRRYYEVRHADGSQQPLTDLRHKKLRCQMFNNMVSACLIRDEFKIELSAEELSANAAQGLQLQLRSKTRDLETLKIPADYIADFSSGPQAKSPEQKAP